MRILHVTECYGGGVSKAINTFTYLAPEEVEHVLLWAGTDKPEVNDRFSTIRKLSKNSVQRILDVRRLAREAKPDLILAHSSWAGFYTRLAQRKIPIVYQPHCYVFEDESRSRLSKAVYYLAEKVLTFNTTATVVLSPREQSITHSLNMNLRTILLPNINSLGIVYQEKSIEELTSEVTQRANTNGKTRIAMLGRISRQKDPEWMISFVERYTEKYPHSELEIIWIGDGDAGSKSRLEAVGIEVTGWKSSEEIAEMLKGVDIYLHTACYEGFPLAVLDALSLDVPTVVRDIPAYDGTPLKKFSDIEKAVDYIYQLTLDNDLKVDLILQQRKLMKTMNQERQSAAIQTILRLAVEHK